MTTPRENLDRLEDERQMILLQTQYTPEQRALAMSMYLEDNMAPVAIALQLGLPVILIETFAERDGWAKRREHLERELVELTASTERRLILEHRPEIRKRHLEGAKEAEEKAREMIREAKSPRGLKEATDALVAASGMAARAAGLTADGGGVEQQQDNRGTPAFNPIIMIGAGPRSVEVVNAVQVPRSPEAIPAQVGEGHRAAPETEAAGAPGEPVPAVRVPGAPGVRSPGPDEELRVEPAEPVGPAAEVPPRSGAPGAAGAVPPVQPEEGQAPTAAG